MSLQSWLVVSALMSRAVSAFTGWKEDAACSWNPLAGLVEQNFCEPDWNVMIQTTLQNETGEEHFVEPGWRGPHGCVKKYCLYSNPGFSNGKGMVAITTEAHLSTLKDLPSQPQYLDVLSLSHVDDVPGKGLGVIADRELKRGDAVMPRPPAFLAHRRFLEDLASSQEQQDLLEKAVTYLPRETKGLFLGQMAHFGGHLINDIFITNGFQVDLGGPDGHHYGNYPEVSRFNHDCRPNLAYYIDSNFVHRTTAVRKIVPGEELTVAYLDPLQPRIARQQRAHSAWGFVCECQQCSLPGALVDKSDGRLWRIRVLEKRMENLKADVTMGDVRELLELYRNERLDAKLAGVLTLAAMNANLLGRADDAREYALRAVEAGLIEKGDGVDVKSMRALAENPKAHFTWRGRLKASK
ncbi:SET domain-containing protein 5 [Neonectria magnoliae]|uniref:SET domain-containing protein 5 n=1 Tax=Neonectria magnoliae TaxID=2732573 RepID=A0ABR1HQE3_9HYPO